jgi:hypothetical protein
VAVARRARGCFVPSAVDDRARHAAAGAAVRRPRVDLRLGRLGRPRGGAGQRRARPPAAAAPAVVHGSSSDSDGGGAGPALDADAELAGGAGDAWPALLAPLSPAPGVAAPAVATARDARAHLPSAAAFAGEGPHLGLHSRFDYYNWRYFGARLAASGKDCTSHDTAFREFILLACCILDENDNKP